ncbi:A/G-specific adenine glycosylase [Candidatus Profftella armatura (Diaphorina cf. continua)]|uniref:Adenine DNA glycosylase n=1 Tax=Candidatus Profftella armatura (Diaphorina cf. continua) TaxID=2661583 RepID=A0A7R7ABR4_9PROT|nr:A/G-specific adenine glycosylase [Candidatus Profftella armatura (Diaphorina cf. continua)]BCG49606.1 A/G-specific adenine glycosylase [Candidatus Profftella armatura (Diaphorina cf. continua)]
MVKKNKIEINKFDKKFFSNTIISWQRKYGRHMLPWQNTKNIYYIWLSEIMLQQTQVNTVIPYYQRFLKKFPNIMSLAQAKLEKVMELWSGLGYYSRARNLHICAKHIFFKCNGIFPKDFISLINLPGIGQSTASAIRVFAYGKRNAILDGNVKRILIRVLGINCSSNIKFIEKKLWYYAINLLPKENIEIYTQGLMDFGSIICVRIKPKCEICPLKLCCISYKTKKINNFLIKRKNIKNHSIMMFIIIDDDYVLFQKRSSKGIWGDLLSFPEYILKNKIINCLNDNLKNFIDLEIKKFVSLFGIIKNYLILPKIFHKLTHLKFNIIPCQIFLKKCFLKEKKNNFIWYPIKKIKHSPIPAPVRKIFSQILKK